MTRSRVPCFWILRALLLACISLSVLLLSASSISHRPATRPARVYAVDQRGPAGVQLSASAPAGAAPADTPITSLPASAPLAQAGSSFTSTLLLPYLRYTQPQVRFAVIGDYGANTSAEGDVAAMVASWAPDFIVTTGDNNYNSGAQATIDINIGKYYQAYIGNYQGSYGPGSTINRFFPVLGNHDWVTSGATPYLNYFTLPGNERYYEMRWGQLHFFAVDSDPNEPDGTASTSTQALWLQSALAASDASYKVVSMHHPPYSSALHGSSVYMRWPYQEWGADLVLAGHDHSYERVLISGFPYIVNGLGGKSIYQFATPIAGSQVRYKGDYGAMLVEVGDLAATFSFFNRSGVLIDSYTLPPSP